MPSASEVAVTILASVVQTFGVRVGTERPPYTILETAGPVEIRRYEPRLAAETTVASDEMSARNEGFRRIAGYIFGGNQTRSSIAMTSPVAQSAGKSQSIAMTSPVAQTVSSNGAWRVQFFMPAKFTAQTLPVPNDPMVRIVQLPAETYAVVRYTGSRNPQAVARQTLRLRQSAPASGWRLTGEPVSWFYDPPWTVPFVRRNEVAIAVTQD